MHVDTSLYIGVQMKTLWFQRTSFLLIIPGGLGRSFSQDRRVETDIFSEDVTDLPFTRRDKRKKNGKERERKTVIESWKQEQASRLSPLSFGFARLFLSSSLENPRDVSAFSFAVSSLL